MTTPLLEIKNLSVNISSTDQNVLKDINLTIYPGEVHVLMGPNGAGKSTLGNTIMGNPAYAVQHGSIAFDGKDITEEATDVRAKAGLFLSFQNPLEVPGISLLSFIRSSLEQKTGERIRPFRFRKQLKPYLDILQMDDAYLDRDLNVGFSGGEKKKAEILQLLALSPKLAILDETDSGLDVDAVRTVSSGIESFMASGDKALLIITHSTRILDALSPNFTHILVDRTIVDTGDASLIDTINQNGFERYIQ